jgi:hypothetical protein
MGPLRVRPLWSSHPSPTPWSHLAGDLQDSPCVADASQTTGATVALGDRSKLPEHAGHMHPGHTFVPASVKTYAHVSKAVMQYIRA